MNDETYDGIFGSIFEILGFLNQPAQDKKLLQRAGISLDDALLPVLVSIATYGPIGIVELAEQVGRDHSTVSRQVGRLVARGLALSTSHTADRRARHVTLTPAGEQAMAEIAAARRALMREALADWSRQELSELEAALGHLAATVRRVAGR